MHGCPERLPGSIVMRDAIVLRISLAEPACSAADPPDVSF